MARQPQKKVVPIRIPVDLIEMADICSHENRTDRSTTLRQWLYKGAEEHAVRLIEQGRLSIGKASELLELSYQDIYRISRDLGLDLGSTAEQIDNSLESVSHLVQRPDRIESIE